jgi:acetylglutamate kinase
LRADRLLFLTDVPGVLDADGDVLASLTPHRARELLAEGTIGGGMIPKVDAALRAAASGTETIIVDGREPGALRAAIEGRSGGTRIG